MKIRSIYIMCLILSIVSSLLFSQNKNTYTIQGEVKDSVNGETLIGANVFIKETQIGTVTDTQGMFSIKLKPGKYVLVISYIGYTSKEFEFEANRDQIINISLVPVTTILEEVKIISQHKFFGNMEYGREIPSISAEVIAKQNINNASDILHASVAGVWATKTSGAPGDHQKIRIRGQNSFFSSAEPLYVVDGVPVPIVNLSSLGISDLNIHDIENVTVLKDASSSALYGFQGGNGVVLIDTKQGGENEINFSTKFGYQWFNNFYDLMSTEDQLASLDSARSKMRMYLIDFYPELTDTLCSRDWQREIFSSGSVQEYQLSASGAKGFFKYYFSGNYMDHNGILPNSEYKRYTFSTRIGRLFLKRLALGLAHRGSVQENKNNQDQYKGNRLIYEGISKSPCLECTPDSLIYNYENHMEPYPRIYHNYYPSLISAELPQSIIENNSHSLSISTHAISGFARLRISEHLNMDIMESFMLRQTDYDAGFTYFYYNISRYARSSNILLKSREDVILFNHQVSLSYYNTFKKHDIGFVLANRYYKDNLWWNVDTLVGSLPEHYSLKNSMAAYGPKGSVLRNMGSYIGHLSYNYRKTYFISAVANISHIKEGLNTNYYSLFPSIALSWDIAQARPLRDTRWLDNLHVYVNWGRSGNYPLNGLANDLYEDVPYTSGETTSYNPSVIQFANHHLKHENTTELDYGIKSSFLNKRIVLNAACYSKINNNLIIQRDIPYYYGGGKQFINIGEISVTGIDIGVELFPVKTKSFTWYMKYNLSTSSQTVTGLFEGKDMSFIDGDILMPEFIIEEGEPMGNIFGYKNLGKWTSRDELANDKHYIEQRGMKYLNPDSNSILNENDKVIIGNSIPDYTWNLFTSFQYKNFGIDFHWYATWGFQKYNATRAANMMTGVNREINQYIADTLNAIRYNYFYESSVFIEDASFIRLKNLSFYYTPVKVLLDKIHATVTLSFENLFTLTKYKGYDPEATIFTDNNFSDNSIDRGSYPNPKALYATISLKF